VTSILRVNPNLFVNVQPSFPPDRIDLANDLDALLAAASRAALSGLIRDAAVCSNLQLADGEIHLAQENEALR
jgi:hypothetical protein